LTSHEYQALLIPQKSIRKIVRPLFDPILALIWSLILMRFMLNLVELGSNYPPLLLIVPKTCSFFILGEIIIFWWKRRLHERFQERLEVRGSSSIKGSKAEQNSGQHAQNRHTTVHPGTSTIGRPAKCRGPHDSAIFLSLFIRFSLTSLDFSLRAYFRVELGFILGLNKLH